TFLEEAGVLFNQGSVGNWGVDNLNIKLTAPEVPKSALPVVNPVNKDYIIKHLKRSVSGGDDGDGNTHAVGTYLDRYSNNQDLIASTGWATSFSTIAGTTIKAVADAIASGVDKSLAEAVSIKTLDEFSKEIIRYLEEGSKSIASQTASHNLRGQLLWLKESLYSTSQNTSYRKLPLPSLGSILAYDAAQLIPPIYPVSVDYFLRETLREVTVDTESLLTFAELLPELATNATLQEVLPQTT
ncbi:GTPase-associated system all-helical protein GASH, partial [Hymenobacter defluvii]